MQFEGVWRCNLFTSSDLDDLRQCRAAFHSVITHYNLQHQPLAHLKQNPETLIFCPTCNCSPASSRRPHQRAMKSRAGRLCNVDSGSMHVMVIIIIFVIIIIIFVIIIIFIITKQSNHLSQTQHR
jgi:hypothetical protein